MVLAVLSLLAGCDAEAPAADGFPCQEQTCTVGEDVCVSDHFAVVTEGADEWACISSAVFEACTTCDCLGACSHCYEAHDGAYCLVGMMEVP